MAPSIITSPRATGFRALAFSVITPPSPLAKASASLLSPPTALMAAVVMLPFTVVIVTLPAALSAADALLSKPAVVMLPASVIFPLAAAFVVSIVTLPLSSFALSPVVLMSPSRVLVILRPASISTDPPRVTIALLMVTSSSALRMTLTGFASSVDVRTKSPVWMSPTFSTLPASTAVNRITPPSSSGTPSAPASPPSAFNVAPA